MGHQGPGVPYLDYEHYFAVEKWGVLTRALGSVKLYQKQLAFGFWERSTGVPPVSFSVLFGFDERK